MSREELRRLLGPPTYSDPRKDFFENSTLHVHYSATMEAELIVVARSPGGEAIFHGKDLLSLEADAAIAVVSRTAEVDVTDPEYPLSCTFRSIDLNLWRPCLPEDSDGVEGSQFEAVGIGVRGYFSRRVPS
jgi:hypothetical protein